MILGFEIIAHQHESDPQITGKFVVKEINHLCNAVMKVFRVVGGTK
jgi:hypothetical protein